MSRTLSRRQAKAVYDRLGALVDWQAVFEDAAVEALIRHADFPRAHAVCEVGCGSGRLAARLLAEALPADASYLALDVSETMVRLARRRLAPWGERAEVRLTDGAPRVPAADAAFDRFVATYVLDLLAEDDIRALLGEARRVLSPEGRLCLASLTFGRTPASRAVTAAWRWLHARSPVLVGGCRPLDLAALAAPELWQTCHREVVVRRGVASEVLVARPRAPRAAGAA